MNRFLAHQFATEALAAGIPHEKIAALLDRAAEISQRQETIKTAGADLVSHLIEKSGMEKNASSVAYTQGLLKEAFDNDATLAQAYEFASSALVATNEKLAFMSKVAEIANNPVLSEYAEGFIGAAKTAGMHEDEAVNLLVELVDNEKRAAELPAALKEHQFHSEGKSEEHSKKEMPAFLKAKIKKAGELPAALKAHQFHGKEHGESAEHEAGEGDKMPAFLKKKLKQANDGMFKDSPAPDSDPAAGAPPGGGAGGVQDEEAQLMQLLQSLPPEQQQQIVQQILAAISGGQGGPGGPGSPTPGAGSPPVGAGGPPTGGPQGPA